MESEVGEMVQPKLYSEILRLLHQAHLQHVNPTSWARRQIDLGEQGSALSVPCLPDKLIRDTPWDLNGLKVISLKQR
jgi:hypothetical protein